MNVITGARDFAEKLDRAEVTAIRREGGDPTEYLNRRAAETRGRNLLFLALVVVPIAIGCALGAIFG